MDCRLLLHNTNFVHRNSNIDVVYEVVDPRHLCLIFEFLFTRKKSSHNLQVEEIIKRSTINLIIAIASLVEMYMYVGCLNAYAYVCV